MKNLIVIIDNFDSFTYNLFQQISLIAQGWEFSDSQKAAGQENLRVAVYRNNELSVAELLALDPLAFIISPGPGTPKNAGCSLELISAALGKIPILGVCLGHQALAEVLGDQIVQAPQAVHGKTSEVFHSQKDLFAGLPSPVAMMRYHSLILAEKTLSAEVNITARTADGLPMAISLPEKKAYGVQFHPESFLSQGGNQLIKNFIELAAHA